MLTWFSRKPPQRQAPAEKRPHQFLTMSARSEAAFDRSDDRLGAHLQAHRELDRADVAYTLHLGGALFQHRRAL